MAATSTLRQILIELVERYGLGTVVPVSSNTTTTFTLTTTGSPELRGPFTGLKIPVGTPVLCSVETSGTSALGNRTYVSNWVPSTGVLTVSPAIGDTDVTEIILLNGDVKMGDSDRLIEAAKRALENRCKRVQKVPLTYVPDGDMLGATISDFWTASAGTASYQSMTFPDVAGARAVQISHSSAATLTGTTIPCRAGEDWYFETAIRATTDGDTAALVIRDVVNSATITPVYEEGDGSTTSRAFVTQRGTFTVPGAADTDGRIAFRLDASGSGTMTAQMAPIIAFPKDARTFPLANRIRSTEDIGNFYRSRLGDANAGPDARSFIGPMTVGGRTHMFSNDGDHLTVTFNAYQGVTFYDEAVYGTALTSMTDTTTFPIDQVVKWAYFELTDHMMHAEMTSGMRLENGALPPSQWRPLRNAAFKSASRSNYEPALLNVVGRRH